MNRYTAFLTHVGMRQFPRQMPGYIEKEHYHVGKKFPVPVLYGIQILYFSPMMFQLEHLPYTGNKCPLAIIHNLLIFLLSCSLGSLSTTFAWLTCYLFSTAQKISIEDFPGKRDQINKKLRVWSHLLKKSSVKIFIFVPCLLTKIYG